MTKPLSDYNLSFAGCGFLGLYHAGVCGCIQEFAPQLSKGHKVSGASAGAIAATFLVCDIKLSDCVHYLMQIINTARSYFLGPFDPRFKITHYLREGLEQYLPEDAHKRCSGHLHISMTNQATHENYIAKNYKDRNELIQAILCSSYIPVFSGFIPLTFRGEWMIDGALTKNTLELDYNTITISPFSGDADICPKDDWGYGQIYIAGTSFLVNPNNFQRIINIFWPKSPEELGKLTQLGYSDCLHYLAKKGFIKCNIHQCHTIFMKVKLTSKQQITDENCKKCRHNLKKALQSALSTNILSSFTSTDTALEKQLLKYLKMLSHAGTLPFSIVFKIIKRCVRLIKGSPRHILGSLLDVVRALVSLDEIFKKAISKAIESNYKHSYFCEALENYDIVNTTDFKDFSDDEESGYSESEESLFDNVDDELKVPHNHCFRSQIEDFDGVLEDVNINSYDEERPDIPGAEDEKMENELPRGEADGKDSDITSESDSECTAVPNNENLRVDLDHQMTWSYPNITDIDETNYFILAPLMDQSFTNSTQSF